MIRSSSSHPRRLILTGICCLLGLIALAGCKRRADDERVHITYWEKWTGAEAAAIQAVVDEFNASQDRITVDLVSVAQVDRKLITATAGGSPPDLAGIWLPNIASFADCDAVLPLDEFMQADRAAEHPAPGRAQAGADFLSRYVPVYARMAVHRGRIYGLVTTPSTVALHWNKTLFREAGLDPERPPRTRAELDEFARRLTRKDPATGSILQAGFLPQEPGWWLWANPLWFGGSFMDAEGEISVGRDRANPAALRWLRSYTDEYGKDELQRFISGFGTFGSPQSAFFNGKVAMVLQGVWLNNYIRQFSPGMDYGVAAWPAVQEGEGGGAPFTVAEADMIVIPRGAKHQKEAWEFIRYLSSANLAAGARQEVRGMETLCLLQEKNSPLKEWSPFFSDHHPHPHIALFRALAESPRAQFSPSMGIWQEYLRELNTANEKVRLAAADPDTAYDYVQQRVEASWARHRASLARQQAAAAASTDSTTP
jgi:ABC-type glycerol-3-phosphate transport system substrate-binding protein